MSLPPPSPSHPSRLFILPKAIYKFTTIPIKIPTAYFTEIENNSKICMESPKTLNSQNNLKNNKAEDITFSDFRLLLQRYIYQFRDI